MAFAGLAGFKRGAWVRRLAVSTALTLAFVAAGPALAGNNNDGWTLFGKKKEPAATQAGNWHNSVPVGKAVTATEIVADGSVSPFIAAESPVEMQDAINRYEAISAKGGWAQLNAIGKMKKGSQGKAVAALNQRLFIEGYIRPEATQGEFAATFTSATEDAVKRFQRNHGLAVTGALDTATVKELNVSVEARLATMRANLPRLAEYSKNLGGRYVTVNVPAMQLETVDGGKVYSRHNAIVGRPSRPTPVVETALATVKFNPYWNAPASIIEKDIIPRMISGGASNVLRQMNITVFKGVGGPEVDPDTVNWRRAVADDYHFRQDPGGDNAMATAKIEFPSPFGIYLHDTPEPQLFAGGMRFLSSGCVRVEKVAILINWILQGQDGIDQARIAELAKTQERLDEQIANPPQLRVAYLTSWPNRNGEVNFRSDIYKMDDSGFVVGQPLDVAETGERFVLKPVARTASAVDADEATGFTLFHWTSSKSAGDYVDPPPKPGSTMKSGDVTRSLFGNWQNGKQPTDKSAASKTAKKAAAKKKVVTGKKAATKATAAKASPTKSGTAAAAAKPASTKTASAKPADGKPAAAKPAATGTDSATKAVTKPGTAPASTSCKPGADGKLPAACEVKPKAAAKPKPKPSAEAQAATATATN